MSFSSYFRTAINPEKKPSIRAGALRNCIRHLSYIEESRSYTQTVQKFEYLFDVQLHGFDSATLSDATIREIAMAVVRERNLRLEAHRREATRNLRRKLQRKAHARKAKPSPAVSPQ